MTDAIVWHDLTLDRDNLDSAWGMTGPRILAVLDAIRGRTDLQLPARMIEGDALVAAFNEGIKYAVAEIFGQASECEIPIRMERFDVDLGADQFVARYAPDGGAAPRP